MPKKLKVPLESTIRVPKDLDREIEHEACRLDIFKYEMVQRAWEAYKAEIAISSKGRAKSAKGAK